MTINGARGTNAKIADRFDLTLACIRRYYHDEPSPLKDTLERYSFFFDLFKSFTDYVNFFFLQDLVSSNYNHIKYFTEPDLAFKTPPIPQTKATYLEYMENSMQFLNNRNNRIKRYMKTFSDTIFRSVKLKDHVCSFCKNKNTLARIVDGEVKFELSRDQVYSLEPVIYSDTRDQANIICIKCESLKFGKMGYREY